MFILDTDAGIGHELNIVMVAIIKYALIMLAQVALISSAVGFYGNEST